MKNETIQLSKQTQQNIRSLFYLIKEPSRYISYNMLKNVNRDMFPIFSAINKPISYSDYHVTVLLDRDKFFKLLAFCDLVGNENRRAYEIYDELFGIWQRNEI